ncbi:hypothetical protein ACGF3J_32030 [Streptomyces sp. NPDC048171]|uniref:hypothetical protein n=1 Tax=Streptomyces sp. NPDC048171 TaxID=3365504 RepID=UPI00371E27E0
MDREKPLLGTVQEALLIPLYARSVETRTGQAPLRNARAEEIVASIDYDFGRFDGLPSLTGALLRTLIASSVTDEAWAAEVTSSTDGPYLFLAEAVLPYLDEADVHQVVDLLADRFPGALLALDTAGPGFFDSQEQHDALSRVEARMHWFCPDLPDQLADWPTGRLAD